MEWEGVGGCLEYLRVSLVADMENECIETSVRMECVHARV